MKRAFAYLLLILAAFFLQNNIFAASQLILTVPNIMLILVFSFGFIRGSVDGMCIGFVCGLLLDIFFSETLGFSALIYTLLGYGIGLLGRLYYADFVDMPLVLCLISDLFYHIGIFVFAFALNGQYGFGAYFGGVIIPELLYTAVMTLIMYPLFRKTDALIVKWETRRTRSFV